jgi:hypothetical protein
LCHAESAEITGQLPGRAWRFGLGETPVTALIKQWRCADRRRWAATATTTPACQFHLTPAGCQLKLTVMDAQLVATLASTDPTTGLRAVLALRRLAEQVEANQVAAARREGWTWQQIGDALGITRQSVHAKYGKR